MKRILFELNHPAHAHLLKNAIRQLIAKGHHVDVLIKEIPVLRAILENESIEFISLGEKGSGMAAKLLKQIGYLRQVRRLHQQNHYDLGVGISVTLPLMSRISSLKAIVLDDDDKKATPLFSMLAHRNSATLLRPQALSHEGNSKNTIYYPGFHELAYLHPAVFTPDASVLEEQGLKQGETFFILRLVAFKAHHDHGIRGISNEKLQILVALLRQFGRVIITSESNMDPFLGAERLKINPAHLHHLMSYAKLIISDGQTMCSEAACLGVPSVRISDFVGRLSTLDVLEKKWKLTFGFRPNNFDQALACITGIIHDDIFVFKDRRDSLVASYIQVSEFLTWFIENFPDSQRIIKQTPAYLNNFR